MASTLSIDPSTYPSLSRAQLGHIRHIHNLATQLDGSWHHMGAQEPLQEFLDAYRYQLATMTYAAAAAHYHHQPLLRSIYKPLIRRLIHKMLCRDVWAYWFTTSLGGIRTDPSLKELRKPWADPIVRENIMYSGHLLLMVSLYAMLFDDDEFEKDGSMEFVWDPLFYGLGEESFAYSTSTLQEAIVKEMERNGWVGVCCEPNMVFVLTAIRYNDIRHRTSQIDDILPKYNAAWTRKGGLVRSHGLFPDMWMQKQDHVLPAQDPGWTAWAATFMNGWNSEVVRPLFERQSLGYLTTIDGETRLWPPVIGNAFRNLVVEERLPRDEARTLQEAKTVVRSKPAEKARVPYTKPMFGYVCMWLSEMGRHEELQGLLKYADEQLSPKWENGGLYYPRRDQPFDGDFNWTHMDPFTGNAAIAFARLNIDNGQKTMWESPWTANPLERRPYVDGVTMVDGVDFARAVWDEEKRAVVITMRSWDGAVRKVHFVVKGLGQGVWETWVGAERVGEQSVGGGEEVKISAKVGGEDVDVVIVAQ